MSDGIAGGQVVGIDLHLYRSVIARIDERGKQLGWVRIDNDPMALVAECRKAGRGVPVGDRGDLRLVLGGRRVARRGVRGTPGAPVGDEGAAQAQAGQDRPGGCL